MKNTHLLRRKLKSAGLLLALGSLALHSQAASVLFDFNTDPTTSGLLTIYNSGGTTMWVPTGGAGAATNANDGYLQITAAQGSQRGAIIFSDFDAGQVVKAFTFEADVRIGNGTTQPADGFSINYVRANDPVLSTANPANDNVWATGPNCEANLPEEGATTGIGIGFDAWNSGGTAPFCNEADQSIGPDIPAVSVRVDGTLLTQFATPTLNGSCTDPTSLQTGPNDGTGNPDILCWAHVKVVLDTNAVLNVYWKGKQILTNYQTAYFPSAGRLAFVGRTGGSWENHHVDNIQITTIPASIAVVGGVTGFPDGFSITVSDSGSSVVNPASVTTTLNGSPVTPAVTKNGLVTTALYHGYPLLLAPGSTNTVTIHALDGNNNPIDGTRTFVTPNYLTINGSLAVTGVNTTAPGFRILPWQSAGEPNRTYWSLEQIAGLHGPNNADLTQATDGGYIDYTTNEINFNITPSSVLGGGEAGNFTTNNGYADALFPGIPGANGLNGSTAENILGFIRFANAGVYTMGVNSDDGFLVSMGRNPNDRFARTLGQFDGGRGSSDTTWIMAVTNAGIYPIRLLWENGNGEAGNGANLEWFTVNNGIKVLINDPSVTNTTGVTVFYQGPALPAYVSHINPLNGMTTARADTLWAQLTDAGTTVNGGSISLKVNGTALTTTITKVGSVTTIKGADTTHLLPAGTNNVTLVWSDSAATTTTNTWSFVVMPYVTLDARMSAPLSAADLSVPGIVMKVSQVDPCMPAAFFGGPSDCGDGTANSVDGANGMIAGLYYPWYGTNSAYVGTVPAPDVVDTNTYTFYWNSQVNFNENGSAGDFGNDNLVPGLPSFDGISGNRPNDSYSMSFDTYVAFPSAGYYIMGVSSDDGFRLTQGWGLPRPILHVKGASVERDVLAIPSTPSSVRDNVWLGALPTTPITAPIAYVDTSECPSPTTMNLAGKIALIDGNRCGGDGADGGYNALVAMCQARGALAVIVQASPSWGTPEIMGGGTNVITIPALHINGFNGEKDWFHTNGPLVATISGDNHIKMGEADFGKGMDHRDFSFIVPVAGVYPLHLIYEQGGGGAGIEWQSIAGPDIAVDTTNRFLVNDNSASSPLLVYRAVTTPPKFLSQTLQNGTLTLVWFGGGTLQQNNSVVSPGTWTDVNPQPLGDTYTVVPTGSPKFYRLRR
jgi:hypothetical protein